MEGLHVLHDEPRFGLAGCDNLRAAIWRDAPTVPQVHTLRDVSLAYARSWPDGTGFLNLIVSGTPRFSEEVRNELAEMARQRQVPELGTAHIVAVDGFRGTAVRAFLGTLFILSRPKTPTKVFGNGHDAGRWLAPLLGRGWTPARIDEVGRTLIDTLGLEPAGGAP